MHLYCKPWSPAWVYAIGCSAWASKNFKSTCTFVELFDWRSLLDLPYVASLCSTFGIRTYLGILTSPVHQVTNTTYFVFKGFKYNCALCCMRILVSVSFFGPRWKVQSLIRNLYVSYRLRIVIIAARSRFILTEFLT